MASSPRYLPQTVDYLGFLANKLRDLQGLATVVNELLQNCDDAPGVTAVCFDVRDDALVVTNNAPFREVDFRRLELISSRGKRDEADTTGAFGIGLIALYQIADRMEIQSAGEHRTIRPDEPEDRRIEVRAVNPSDVTEFRFPWAFDPESRIRKELDLQAITQEDPARFVSMLMERLPAAALFLRKIETLEVRSNGLVQRKVQRTVDADEVLIDVDGATSAWKVIRGSFESAADRLRAEVPERIPQKLTANVSIAVPDHLDEHGLLYAFLPTEQSASLPLHINADFFTTSDRKRIVLDPDYRSPDYRSTWNRAAISAAAEALAANLEILRDHLGPKGIWDLITEIQSAANKAEFGEIDVSFRAFWDAVRPEIRRRRLILTTRQDWCHPDDAYFLATQADEQHVHLLEGLGIATVDSQLRPRYTLLTGADVGVPILNSENLAGALRDCGMSREVPTSQAPNPIRSVKGLKGLWELIDSVVSLDQQQRRHEPERHFISCAISKSKRGELLFPESVYRADPTTARLFQALDPAIQFLDDLGASDSIVARLSPPYGPDEAIDLLAQLHVHDLMEAWQAGKWTPMSLYRWFEGRREEILQDSGLTDHFRDLPIFPAGNQLKPLSKLSLPGTFEDPLRLTSLVDVAALGGRKEFLRDLGVQELSLEVYASEHIPAALERSDLPASTRRQVATLLAEHIGILQDHSYIRDALTECDLVECQDSEFRAAGEVYLRTREVVEALADSVHYTKSTRPRPSVRELYAWLGVASAPKARDVVRRVEALVDGRPSKDSIAAVARVFRYLGKNWGTLSKHSDAFDALKSLEWLPATNDRTTWFEPARVYASYRRYLFDSQGNFLNFPLPDQQAAAGFLQFLGVSSEPPPYLVVRHLLHCADVGTGVNASVYSFLNDHADDTAIEELLGSKCILLPNGDYIRPDQVFWSRHQFGRFRYQLGEELRQYHALFTAIGVRDEPEPDDAVAVLGDIEAVFGASHRPLDDEGQAVVAECWRILTAALDHEGIDEREVTALGDRYVIPNAQRVLQRPKLMFVEDRPGLAHRFALIKNDLVERRPGVWPAMQTAGVRKLSDAVQTQLVECADPTEEPAVRRRLVERMMQIRRVLEAHRDDLDQPDLSVIEGLFFFRTQELVVQHVLRAYGREEPAEPEMTDAFLDSDNNSLYYLSRSPDPHWSAIARELVYVLGFQNAGPVALGLTTVLEAGTAEEARRRLDHAGYPPLEEDDLADYRGAVVGALGATQGQEDTSPDITWAEGDEESTTPFAVIPEEGAPAAEDEQETEPSAPPSRSADSEESPRGQPHADGSRPSGQDHGHSRRRGRLRSYVVAGAPEESDAHTRDADLDAALDEVDLAGIDRVLSFELSQGRDPTLMDHGHPGYDIESRLAGEKTVERYIEVKSVRGQWDSLGAGLSRAQFEKARELGEEVWLYVVEHALDDALFRIYTVQDPARKIDQYLYDDGWKAVATTVWPAEVVEKDDLEAAEEASEGST